MNYDDFVMQVRDRAHLGTSDDALKAIQATLEVLSERLSQEEANDLASQLPKEFKPYLTQQKETESFDVNEFFRRVSKRERVELDDAGNHAKAVVSVICDAVSPGELRDVLGELPEDYDRLFELASGGTILRGTMRKRERETR